MVGYNFSLQLQLANVVLCLVLYCFLFWPLLYNKEESAALLEIQATCVIIPITFPHIFKGQ